jgi:hypothetical protein
LAIFYLIALPKNPSPEAFQPVLDELKLVDELSPDLASDVHDMFEFSINTDPSAEWVSWSDYWAAATATVASMRSPSATPTQQLALASTPIPPTTAPPLPTATASQPGNITGHGQSLVLILAAGVICLVVLGYLALNRRRATGAK